VTNNHVTVNLLQFIPDCISEDNNILTVIASFTYSRKDQKNKHKLQEAKDDAVYVLKTIILLLELPQLTFCNITKSQQHQQQQQQQERYA